MALRPTKGMLTSESSYPTKGLPGETDPFDPNARTTSFRQGDPTGAYRDNEQERYIVPDILMRLLQGIGQSEIGTIWADPSIEEILLANSIKMNPEAPLDLSVLLDSPEAASQVFTVIQESLTEAQEIADVLSSGDITSLEDMEAPSGLTTTFLEQGGLQFAGAAATTPTTTVGGREVIRGGAGVTVNVQDVLDAGGRVFGANVPEVDADGNPVLDREGNPKTNYIPGILDAVVPYIPGVSLPNWMPTAGVIFLPSVGEAINKVNDIAGQIGEAIEDGESIGGILEDIGAIVIQEGEVLTDELRTKWDDLTDKVKEVFTKPKRDENGDIIYKRDEDGNIVYNEDGNPVAETTIDPTGVAGVLAGVITGSYPDALPSWMPDLLGGILIENLPNVYNSVRDILIGSGATTTQIFPPAPTTEPDPDIPIGTDPDVDPTLMFTNRGNNYFVSSEGDEYFQLAESEDLDFELNGQYTREQLENTGLETIGSGTYQSLIDDLSFHALEEDIYQYSLEDLRTRYEEEGGIIPGDWKEMDDESKYGFLLDDYFEIPTQVSDPDRGEPPTDQPDPTPAPTPDPTPDPDPDPDADPDVTSVIEGLFADFLDQLDTEFTGQQDQINTIINNFVETLPDFDAMPTMADIAEYFEINGVTLSQQNFDRIREELSNAGYLTQEQLTEALQGVATPEQVQQAIEGAGFATPEQVIQALAEAGYATPDDITTALANSNFVTEDRMLLALAEAGYATPEQVEQIVNNAVANIVIPEGATTEEVRQLIQEAIDGIPAGISLDDVSGVVNEAIANIDFPEGLSDDDVRNIVGSFGFTTSEEVRGIINEAIAGIVIPEGATTEEVRQLIQEAVDGIPEGISLDEVGGLINEAIANIDFPPGLSGDDVRGIVDSFGFATTENVRDIVNTAISNIQFPEGATTEEVQQLIQNALDGLPEGISLEDIGGIVNEAIANIQFPEGLSEGDVRGIVDSFGFATSTDVQAGFDDLNDKLDSAVNGLSVQLTEQEAEFLAGLTGVEASVLQQLAATEGGLRSELETLGFNLTEFQSDVAGRFDQFEDTFAAFQTDVSSQFSDLNDRFDDALDGIATQFSDQEAEFLASVTGLEASFIQSLASVEGGLSTELEMLGTDIISLQQNVAGRFDEFEQTVGQQLTQAEQDRIRIEQGLYNALQLQSQGQAVQLNEAEARLLAEITGGDAALLQEMSSQTGALENQLTSLGLNLNTVTTKLKSRH